MLPEAFLDRIKGQLGDEYPAFLESLERPRAVALRFNPLKGEPPALPFVGDTVPWEPMGCYYDPNSRPGLHPYHEAGVYYLQEASAMSAVALLEPQPGERICDLCAAPGGKTTQIAGRMMGEGFLLCNEINPKRAKILSRNIERMGVANALVTNEHPQRLADRLPGYFDRVLIDAPCSGEGMFRKEEAAVTDWSPETVEMCARRQAEILHSGAQLVRPGGRLVYSTCTFAPCENEGVCEYILENYPDMELLPIDLPMLSEGKGEYIGSSADFSGTKRIFPHKNRGEGHFLALFRKKGEGSPCSFSGAKPSKAVEEAVKLYRTFEKEALEVRLSGEFVLFGENLYLMHLPLNLNGLKVVQPGLHLGQCKKGRFEPAHALALALSPDDFKNICEFSAESADIKKYLHGDTLEGEGKGWTAVVCDGISLGWAKASGGVLKNHFPKGLRTN